MVAFGALIKTLLSKLMVTVRLNLFIMKQTWLHNLLKLDFFLAVCSRFFEWDFFLKSLNLANEGQVNIISANIYQSCQVVPRSAAYYNYQLENKWVGINLEMFKVEKTILQGSVPEVFLNVNACKPAVLQPLWPVTHNFTAQQSASHFMGSKVLSKIAMIKMF